MTLERRVSQEEFASMVGITQQRVGQLIGEGVLGREDTALGWLRAYCERLREQAAGRGQELTLERAALARSQRHGQDLKNAIAEKTYGPIALLTDVLASASASIADRFDALPGELRKACPDLTEAQRLQVESAVAAARNQWVRETARLAVAAVDELAEEPDDDEPIGDLDEESIA